MHEITGLQYSICRKKLKENHWSLYCAIGFDQLGNTIDNIGNALVPVIESFADVALKFAKVIAEIISNIYLEAVKEAVDEYYRQNCNEPLSLEISAKTDGAEEETDL